MNEPSVLANPLVDVLVFKVSTIISTLYEIRTDLAFIPWILIIVAGWSIMAYRILRHS